MLRSVLLGFVVLVMLVLAVFAGDALAGEAGRIKGNVMTSAVPEEQATRSQADHYDLKKLTGNVDTTNIVVATKWGTTNKYLVKCIWNNSATAVVVKVRTSNGAATDTIPIKIPAYQWTLKLPEIHTIYRIGATDTLLIPVQVE